MREATDEEWREIFDGTFRRARQRGWDVFDDGSWSFMDISMLAAHDPGDHGITDPNDWKSDD